MQPTTRRSLAAVVALFACGGWIACSSSEGTQDRTLSDAAAPDTAAPVDAGTDALEAGPSAPGCAGSSHTFCEDFDTLPLGASWEETKNSPKETLSLVNDVAYSAPRSLQIQLPGGAGAEGRLEKTISLAASSRVTVGFDWRIASAGTPNLELFSITLRSSATGESSTLTLSAGDLYTLTESKRQAEAGVTYNQLIGSTVERDVPAWTRVECEIGETGGAGHVTFRVGGATVLDSPLTLAVPAPYDTTTLTVGPNRTNFTKTWLVHVDNVTLDAAAN